MLGSKIFLGSTLLMSTTSTSFFKAQPLKSSTAECAPEMSAAEKGAADLDRILSQASEGGIPPDPEEIQELLMKA